MSALLQGEPTNWLWAIQSLAPVLLLAATALAVLVIDSIWPNKHDNSLLAGTSLAGTLAALGVTAWYLVAGTGQETHGGAIYLFSDTIVVDGMGLFFIAIVTSVTALVVVGSYDYLDGEYNPAAFYSLLLFAATAMTLMAVSNSLVTVFVSLEMASLPSYALVAYLKNNKGSVEAGLKYFLIGALSAPSSRSVSASSTGRPARSCYRRLPPRSAMSANSPAFSASAS